MTTEPEPAASGTSLAGTTSAPRSAGGAPGDAAPWEAGEMPEAAPAPTEHQAEVRGWTRRRVIVVGGAVIGGLVVAAGSVLGVLERLLAGGGPGTTMAMALPSPAAPAPTIGPEAALPVTGITPLVTPNDAFFQVDTAFIDPTVDLATWRLRMTGMVEREGSYGYDDLRAMPLAETWATIACVSNDVGGDLVGNARWTGVPLTLLLESAGVMPGATQVVGRSVDGFTAGFPTAWALDPARTPLVALGMNGAVLPVEHGFPARLIVPGLFGYVSATKWLAEIELTTLEGFDAYWVPRGWAKEAPILTQSRIDVPGDGARVAAGPVDVAGVAWAPDRGVSRVEVRLDGGPWQRAELGQAPSPASWVQWALRWPAEPGAHTVEVRATDGLGIVQPEERTSPAPDGARGYHRVRVQVD